MIRVIHPQPTGPIEDLVSLADAAFAPGGDRPWVAVNMVSSVDGGTAFRGGATALTDPDDQALFRAFRAVCDVVLVGASTVRAEDYGPVTLSAEAEDGRRQAGRSRVPRLAVVTGSLRLDPDARLFSDPSKPPIILTGTGSDATQRREFETSAEVVVGPGEELDLAWAIDWLAGQGYGRILCEGGPTVNGQLLAADLVDEFNLSHSPVATAGEAARIAHGDTEVGFGFRLSRVMVGDTVLFSQWIRSER